MKHNTFARWLSLGCLALFPGLGYAQSNEPETSSHTRTLARLFWQDMDSATLHWGDLKRVGNDWELQSKNIESFPTLNPETQSLVQMEALDDMLVLGVHDTDRGNIGSGWAAIASGVELESHGDHSHAHFDKEPRVVQQAVDTQQGNPAHVYRYAEKIFIANDAKNGFTILQKSPSGHAGPPLLAQFVSGGGNHITLAAVADQWCYCTWADREGENLGRVDVVPIGANSHSPAYTMHLASGGLHGATTNAGKVFFAPMDGVHVLDPSASNTKPASPHILSLGTDPKTGKPYRTGAFASHSNYVLFAFGSGEQSKLGLIDAKQSKPKLIELPLDATSSTSPSTPQCITGANGKQYAWVVLHQRDGQSPDVLLSIDLDPNGDNQFNDAKLHGRVNLGKSKIEGHSGHHEIEFLPNRRTACVSNPGDGSLWILSIHSLEVLAKLSVSGAPTRLAAFGD